MWEAISDIPEAVLDTADPVYRRWARTRIRSGRLAAFIAEDRGRAVASGCVWLMPVQPRPHWRGTTAGYLLSMFTEPDARGKGHANRIVRAAIRWAKGRGVRVMLLHASRFGEPIYRRLGFESTTEMRLRLEGPTTTKARSRRAARKPRRRKTT